jgi:hypothetical protein
MSQASDGLSIFTACNQFDLPARSWQLILALAQRYGWQPQGTMPPDQYAVDAGIWRGEPSSWDGRYFPAYGQNVAEADAEQLGAALERAMPDIPDHCAVEDKRNGFKFDWGWTARVPPGITITALEAFSGPNKETLRLFITDCGERGGLWLY